MDEQKKFPDQPGAEGHHAGTRRRGEVLEEAILQAAWEELSTTGYTHLTMEKVAARAGTNKAVLYRRWANKSDLVIAALHKYVPRFTNEIPNTGNLRDDVYAYLHGIAEPLKSIGAQTIRGLMTEQLGSTLFRHLIESLPQLSLRRSESKMMAAMMAILKNAELRGEVRLEKLAPRIISLPLELLRNEIITRLEPISDEAIEEIIDDIFLPLVRI
jgi:AcrR family transcriptional regulator